MALRKPIKIDVLEELHDRLADLRERAVAVGWQPHEVYEHALFFGLPAAAQQVERAELDAERARNAAHLIERKRAAGQSLAAAPLNA